MHTRKVIVIGSGLAGLAAAITAARAGAQVMLLERASATGGRATTSTRRGYMFNIGPHALYAPAEARLRDLGISVHGGSPPLERTVAWRERHPFALPLGTTAMLSTELLDDAARVEARALFARLPELDTAALQGVTIEAWLERSVRSPAVRSLVAMLLRVSSYANAPEIGSAGAHLDHLRRTSATGVRYVDGGWQTIVDGLRERALASRVQLAPNACVTRVAPSGSRWRVAIGGGAELESDAVILAVGPTEASKLARSSATLARWAERAVPVEAATLDVALARVPNPALNYSVGLDRPLYFSVHSAAARLAPPGGGVLHAAMYLPVTGRPSRDAVREELEWLVDQLQPGWRDQLVHARHLPHIMVTNAHVTAADGGLPGRAGPRVDDAAGLYVAGDWVGSTGMLAEAALASGISAAQLATRAVAELQFPARGECNTATA